MSSPDREEIRWKFQMLIDSLKASTTEIENQQKSISESYYREDTGFREIRKFFLGGIGFGIMYLLTLISVKILPDYYVFYSIFGVVVGFVIFILINSHLYSRSKVSNGIDMKYDYVLKKLNAMKAMIFSFAMNDSITMSNVSEIVILGFLYEDVLRYNLAIDSNVLTKSKLPDQKQYQESHSIIKSISAKFSTYGMNFAMDDVNTFINNFAKIEQNMTNIGENSISKTTTDADKIFHRNLTLDSIHFGGLIALGTTVFAVGATLWVTSASMLGPVLDSITTASSNSTLTTNSYTFKMITMLQQLSPLFTVVGFVAIILGFIIPVIKLRK